MKGYESQDLLTIPSLINKLISNQIEKINTCFIAKVVSVNDNLVDIVNVNKSVFGDDAINSPIINNVLVCLPYVKNCSFSIPVGIGDFGFCIVCQSDISSFKNSGDLSVPASRRKFNINDSIFIPCSLNNTNISDIFEIRYKENINLTFNDDGIIISNGNNTIKIESSGIKIETDSVTIENASSSPIEIKNQVGSIGDAFAHVFSMLDLLSQGMVGAGTNPSAYTAGKPALQKQIENIVS